MEPRVPDSESDGQTIDIFVFSNGQQYSPPRKYHLQAEDLNLWKSTLSFLAKTQYGPFHSTVDLYTIEGSKVGSPLQLSNGASYVAVQPPDSFINSGYDKYLIKASRSWEKRKLKRNEAVDELDDSKPPPNMENIDENHENQNIQPVEENVIYKSRQSSTANHDASTIIKPQLLSAPQRRSDSLSNAKQTDRKKTSIQSPLLIRKIAPSSLPATNVKTSFNKKKDNIKSSVKIVRPEDRKHLSDSSPIIAKPLPRLGKPMRPPSKPKVSTVRTVEIVPKVQEASNEQKTTSVKVTTNSTKNDEKLSTNSADLKNVIEDKELVLVSKFLKNSLIDMPKYVNPASVQSVVNEPVRQQANTTFVENPTNSKSEASIKQVNSEVKISVLEKTENVNNHEIFESINIIHNKSKNHARDSIEKLQIDKYPNPAEKIIIENNKTLNDDVKTNDPNKSNEPQENILLLNDEVKINDNNSKKNDKTQDSPKKLSIKKLSNDQNKPNDVNKLEDRNEITFSNCKSIETIKVYNSSPPRSSIVTERVLDDQCVTAKIVETRDLQPRLIETSLNDQYIATLKNGDVVNLKLNIEIENRDGNQNMLNEHLNYPSVTIIHTDKGSQSNFDDQIIAQNKSLLSLISKEFNNQNVGDTHRVIVIHYNSCKYCSDYNATNPNNETNRNYVILIPIEKYEDLSERCYCNDTQPETQNISLINAVKPAHSCTSLERLTKLTADAETQNICTTPDMKSVENAVVVTRKKSVAINEESTLSTHVPSKTNEIDVRTQFLTVSVESTGIVNNVIMVDNSTQTEWCDVLLEARLLSDGHYTFRLPSLELLKYYKLT